MPASGFPHRLLICVAMALMGLFLCNCGASVRVPVTGPPTVMAVDPCADIEDAACPARLLYVRKAFASTVRIHVSRYTAKDGVTYGAGTGEVIDERGTVLSAFHVVKDARLIVIGVRMIDENANIVTTVRDIPMSVVSSQPELDLVLLRPSDPDEKLPAPFVVRRDAPTAGEELWHFGNVSFWAHGKVTATNVEFNGKRGLTKARIPCRHGDSGGPFVDLEGRLTGVLLHMDSRIDGRGSTFYLPVGAALDALGYRP